MITFRTDSSDEILRTNAIFTKCGAIRIHENSYHRYAQIDIICHKEIRSIYATDLFGYCYLSKKYFQIDHIVLAERKYYSECHARKILFILKYIYAHFSIYFTILDV